MKIATTKQRIIQYLDYKGIKVREFLEKTDIKRGFLDSDKLESSVSDIFITKIIANYSDLNIHWLLTGEGEMIKVVQEHSTYQQNDNDRYISSLEKINALQEKEIARLEQEKKALQEKITQLKKDTKPPIPHQSLVK
ncbi:MAG: hypothetical protein KBA33_11025 [Cloacibacterium sp.]|nr:hypothetical protein [Cloacibacterium sp.]